MIGNREQIDDAGLAFTCELRLEELDFVIRRSLRKCRILELGAGAGWQASELVRRGFDVEAYDIEESNYRQDQVAPIKLYDGRHIPASDRSFDAIFTSNVLEHVPHLETLLYEMRRVVAADGLAVHIVPSPAWRIWTNVTHFPAKLRALRGRLSGIRRGGGSSRGPARHDENRVEWYRRILPTAHGERGNALTEAHFLRAAWWAAKFEETGWELRSVSPTPLFYTGNRLLGPRLTTAHRRRLALVLGGASNAYVCTPSRIR